MPVSSSSNDAAIIYEQCSNYGGTKGHELCIRWVTVKWLIILRADIFSGQHNNIERVELN